ncbi:tRNA adenosine(34) deaminase TadA [Candidatus Hakubella thermalkaliphila]|uniref:tRNA-specific adenosine deaminase n=2 Tax=Candidatus Hakubella thermalkaliphila TaxID=2754717 RepID=A0A6V8P9S5_9ACTN|nr:tRNA adenosine(34) deaminase TadA [Candidatus Hakubella thermalkaliphila]GFP29432.1 tRNA(adenine34) deaminase [Candidatus Hakubella thermalkaliphila]GFP40549.1 tRNA(adenine34) deaminase [Candidatus Hakubella thermalkaliphila]
MLVTPNTTTNQDEHFMHLALAQARLAFSRKEVPIGAVIVREEEVIARAFNRRESDQDPTAHAEILCIRKAARKLKSWRLSGLTLYVTIEPCPMCAGAIYLARIDRLVYGVRDERAGSAGTLYNIVNDPRLNHRVQITAGVCEGEAAQLMQDFFERLRYNLRYKIKRSNRPRS